MDRLVDDIGRMISGIAADIDFERVELELSRQRAEESERQRRTESRSRVRLRERRLRECCEGLFPLPPATSEMVVHEQLDDTKAMRIATRFAQSAASVVCFLGPTGVGKTVAAAHLIASTPGARYVKANRLPGLTSAQFGADRELYLALATCPMLVIDEVGTEATEEGSRRALQIVIDDRLSAKTLVISNLTKAEFESRLDARTLERIAEVGHVVELGGESRRRAK